MQLQDPVLALQQAKRQPGIPYYSDFPVVASFLEELSTESKIVLELQAEDGRPLCRAWVFQEEWFPDIRTEDRVRYSHYFLTLKRAFQGLRERHQSPTLRLQVLKFVYSRGLTVLLKFVIGPEYSLNATQLQNCYGCPLQTFFQAFMGVSRDVRLPLYEPRHLAGTAIHAGYSRAAAATWREEPYEARVEAYWSGVTEVWARNFAYLASDNIGTALKAYHWQPVQVIDVVLARCREKVSGATELLQEREFFSSNRGLAGKADRITRCSDGWHIYEIKTSSNPLALRDPQTGQQVPGGIQSLIYLEILRTHSSLPSSASVEEFRSKTWQEVTLEEHPVMIRAKATPRPGDDNYLDLWAQLRNVGYVVTTGLATGYNRSRITELIFSGWRLRGMGGRFDLYSGWPPCTPCAAHLRGVCDADRKIGPTTWPNFWLHVPQRLWEYWAWFHYQLKQQEAMERHRLFRIATVKAKDLETKDGTCITGLKIVHGRGRNVLLHRDTPVITRIRNDDHVLLTPEDCQPGALRSVRGTVVHLEADGIHLSLHEDLSPETSSSSYRVDQLGRYELIDWGIKGLSDFLISSMFGSGVFGRPVALEELPHLTQSILGTLSPPPLRFAEVPLPHIEDLNNGQQQAVRAALALEPGQFLLVQGPPGTGKTQTIARMALLMALREFWDKLENRRPVLVLAFTHRACDEIVKKLKEIPELSPYVIRVGDVGPRIDHAARDRVLSEIVGAREKIDLIRRDSTDLSPLTKAIRQARLHWEQALIFVGTLASAERPELAGLTFSNVIVDEAGQATEPQTLQALRHMPKGFAARLVLVGDHFQLPPVVQEDIAALPLHPELQNLMLDPTRGLQLSLFERLASLYPHRLVVLEEQFRMNEAICALISNTFYGGKLRPASEHVASRTFALSGTGLYGAWEDSLLKLVWDPERPIVFIDTSGDPRAMDSYQPGPEEVRVNEREATIVAQLVRGLLQGMPALHPETIASEIGIISPYRSQNNLIAAKLDALRHRLRVDTVDRFQGSECEGIVISLVDNNPQAGLGKLHRDWRRLNVAASRARTKLIIVGSRANFTRPGPYREKVARQAYRRFFKVIENLAQHGKALVLDSRRFD